MKVYYGRENVRRDFTVLGSAKSTGKGSNVELALLDAEGKLKKKAPSGTNALLVGLVNKQQDAPNCELELKVSFISY